MLRLNTHILSPALFGLALALSGCHFEARVGSGDDAEQKKPNKAAKADDKDEKKADQEKKANKKEKKADQEKPAKEEPPAAEVSKDAVALPGNLVFEAGKATLKAGSGSEEVLAALKTFLDQQPRVTLLRLEGHSDNSATPAESLKVSGERALTIKRWLVEKGINQNRLLAVGFGETKPIADNSNEEGRAQNRRVEFKIAKVNDKNYLGADPLAGGTEFK